MFIRTLKNKLSCVKTVKLLSCVKNVTVLGFFQCMNEKRINLLKQNKQLNIIFQFMQTYNFFICLYFYRWCNKWEMQWHITKDIVSRNYIGRQFFRTIAIYLAWQIQWTCKPYVHTDTQSYNNNKFFCIGFTNNYVKKMRRKTKKNKTFTICSSL